MDLQLTAFPGWQLHAKYVIVALGWFVLYVAEMFTQVLAHIFRNGIDFHTTTLPVRAPDKMAWGLISASAEPLPYPIAGDRRGDEISLDEVERIVI